MSITEKEKSRMEAAHKDIRELIQLASDFAWTGEHASETPEGVRAGRGVEYYAERLREDLKRARVELWCLQGAVRVLRQEVPEDDEENVVTDSDYE